MTGQDLVGCASHARVRLPEHISLAISVKHLTGSKQLITVLSKIDHCSSYEEIENLDTCLAKEILAKSEETWVTIPSSIFPGIFVQVAGGNNELK